MENEVKGKITDFIVSNYLFGDVSRKPQESESLITTGIVDSTGVLELIEFLESSFGIQVKDTETIPQNLDSIANLTRFVMGKKA
jgi:acyl carrier protein